MKILIIEDDTEVADNLTKALTEQGFIVDSVNDGISGLTTARQGDYHVLIVDRMLPGLDGVSLIRQLRASGKQTPALMLTALGEVDDRVEGLEAGADDYLGKPFAVAELLARLRALAKRSPTNTEMQVCVSDLTLDKIQREVTRNGKKINLKPREFELLLYLCNHINKPVTRDMLLRDVWGFDFDPQTNVIDVHISRLRQCVDKNHSEPLIHTVRGVGYIFGIQEKRKNKQKKK